MKKLMIAAAIVCAAVAANAASVTWTLTGATLPSGGAASGVAAYLFKGTLSTKAIQAALDEGTWDPTKETGYLYSKSTNTSGGIAQMGIGSFQNETVTFSMVLFDTSAIVTKGQGNWKYAEVPDVVFTTMNKVANFSTAIGGASWTSYGEGPEPTPEPTSALLMLLGVAGLALKRKQK